jgi:hypothetical protein
VSQPLHPVLHRITLSGDDFRRAAEFAKAARLHPVSSIEHEALVHSAILFYARPWLDNEERKSNLPKDARMLIGIDLAGTLGDNEVFHERIIRLRKKVIAHAEAEFFPAQHGGPLKIGNKGTRGLTMVRRIWHVTDEQLDLELLEQIAITMKKATMNLAFAKAAELGVLQERTD